MSRRDRTEYLEETFRLPMPRIRELIAVEVGTTQGSYTYLSKDTIEAVAREIGVDHIGRKRRVLNRLREAHPKLDENRTAGQCSRPELRELYATLAAEEPIDEPTSVGQLAHV